MKCTLRSKGRRYPCVIQQDERKLYFVRSPFALKNELKAMKGAKWNPSIKQWSVKRCPRNLFQLRAMMVEPTNENPYAHFEQDLVEVQYTRPLQVYQVDMLQRALTYHYQIFAADMGLGKTLLSIEIAERAGGEAWYVGPRSALESVYLETKKWNAQCDFNAMTYERLMTEEPDVPPKVLILDESTSCKNPTARRTIAAQKLADRIREYWGLEGYVILLSGSPTAKKPSDIWAQAEIAWPGFLREGSLRAFESRYANVVQREDADGVQFRTIEGWKEHEVAKLPKRLDGLMSVYRKSEELNLPTRHFLTRECKPTKRINRIGKQLVDTAPNTITALTRLRALSSGFQYKEEGGTDDLGQRAKVETVCPKDDILRAILAEEDSQGRVIAYAGFQGSIDRVARICREDGWHTCMVDGRGWRVITRDGEHRREEHVLDFWANEPGKVALVGNPASCRYGLTLVEAKTIVVFDQGFGAEHRLQSLDRNYRIGQEEEVRVIDLLHLPVDHLVLDTLKKNRKLELLSIDKIREALDHSDDTE